MTDVLPTPLALALGRLPTGLFVASSRLAGSPVGFIASFVTQVGIEPPTVCMAVGKQRDHLAAIREHGHFALSILSDENRDLMGSFFKPPAEGKTPFDELETLETPSGCPVPAQALAWIECRLDGEHTTGDHIVVFGEVVAGTRLREGEPAVHLRKSGLGY